MAKYTKEEKREYYRNLRKRWQDAKDHADHDEISAIIANHGLNISIAGYAFVAEQMEALGFDGIPYIDMKTYKGWKDNGFQVMKGEKAKVNGLTWISPVRNTEDIDENEPQTFKMAKVYKLFHRSQVQEV